MSLSIGVVVETSEVFQGSAIGELILVLGLYHGGPLAAQQFAGGEEIDDSFVTHALQHDRKRDEHARPTNTAAAMNCDRTVLRRRMRWGRLRMGRRNVEG